MPEVLRDLVVSLSLKSDNFTRNINSINRQIREAESQFRLAGAGVDRFGSTTAGMNSRMTLLQTTLQHQRAAVDQYERALAKANSRLQESHARYQTYSTRLQEVKQRHDDLADKLRSQEDYLREIAELCGTDCDAYRAEAEILNQLQAEYAPVNEEMKKLTGQCDALQKAMQKDADAVSKARTDLNNAKAAVRETESEIRKLNEQLRTAGSAWTDVGKQLEIVSKKFTAFGKEATKIGKTLSKTITAPVLALGTYAMKASLDFELSFASVRRTVNGTEEDFEHLAEVSKSMSTEIATSTDDINFVMATGGQLGIETENIESFTRAMIDLSNASTDLDAETAATQLAKFANIMGTSHSDFDRIGSAVAELGNNFATTEAPIVEMAMRLAGAGKQVGLSEAQVLGLSAALSSVGIKAQAGGSSMSKALIEMEVAAKQGGQALTDFAMVCNMTEEEFVNAWSDDPVQVFQAFIEGLAQMDDEGASAIVTLNELGISEIRLRDTLLRATNAHELFANAQAMATSAYEANTALADKSSKKYNTLASRMTNVKNKAKLFAQTLGNDLRPTIEKILQGVSNFIDRLEGMSSGQRKVIITLAALAAAAGPVLIVIGKLSTGIGVVTKLMSKFSLAMGSAGGQGMLGRFTTAVSSACGGIKGLMATLVKSPAVWAAVGAAVAYGTYKLIDYVSGAKAAREAQERLNETVKQWGENVSTVYENSRGMSAIGLSAEDFKLGKKDESQGDWLEQTITTWTDGKKETDEIVQDTVKGFTDGTERIRTSLKSLQDSTGGTVVGDLDGDLEQLDAIDKEVEAILKKKQNGYLSDDEKKRLQELIDQRDAIKVKYQLVTDSDDAFDQIVMGVEAAMSRGADSATTFTDAYAAATQGFGAFTDSLNAEYDARYKVIQAMEDGAEKEQALIELRKWYDEQGAAATKQYYETLKQTAEETGVFAEGGQFAETAEQLRTIDELMHAAAGKDSKSAEMTALRDALAGLDESSIVEMEAAIAAMETAAADAGETVPDEVLAAKTALEEVKAAALDTSNVFSDDVAESIKTMFTGLSDEVHEVYASLNCDNLSTAYDAWAAGEHASIIPTIATDTIDVSALQNLSGTVTAISEGEKVTVDLSTLDALNGTVTVINDNGEATTVSIASLTGLSGTVTAISEAKTVSVDLSTLDTLNGTVTVISDSGEETTVSISSLSSLSGTVTAVSEGKTVTIDLSTLDTLEGTVTAIGEDGTKTTVSLSSLDGLSGTVTGYVEGKTVTFNAASLAQLDGTVTTISIDPETVLPTVELNANATVKTVNFEEGEFTNSSRPDLEFEAGGSKTNENILGLTDFSAPETVSRLHNLAEAVRDLNAAQAEVKAQEELGPDMDPAAYDEANMKVQTLSESLTYLGETFGGELVFKGGLGFQAMAQYIANGMQLMNDGALDDKQLAQYMQVVSDLITVMGSEAGEVAASLGTTGTTFSEGLANAMTEYDWGSTGTTIYSDITTAFQAAGGDMSVLGDDIAAGIGEGEAGHDFSGDAGTTISNDESALREAANSNSPAVRFNPLGNDIAAGIGQGMTQYDFTAEAGTTINALKSAFSASALADVGRNAMAGLAQGIRNGTASVVTAMRLAALAAVNAAKETLKIESPSRVFRDEVGVMMMRGLGEGVLDSQREQARIIQNASRYLTEQAQGGIVVGNTHNDNRQNIQQTSSVNLSGNNFYVRSDRDIHDLAVEIATLTRTEQRGRGLRMA